MYHTYRVVVRHRRTQALEKLFRLNTAPTAVNFDETLSTAAAITRVYDPIPLPISKPISDMLSSLDIPLGQGGFARDYIVNLSVGDQVVIELKSERFDTFVSLLASDGSTVGENDDGPDGTTNSLLIVSIPKSDTYTVRVQASGEAKEAVGPFTLFVTPLGPKSCIQF
ncbi:MAG: PPC domain-containing protein [Stigonema ocellatum SAG 48.90 = DSM 106950]|nr:PPC domain-containing protein [Stigonema ocellatum SAG 48.90 = DSM 106950]